MGWFPAAARYYLNHWYQRMQTDPKSRHWAKVVGLTWSTSAAAMGKWTFFYVLWHYGAWSTENEQS